VLRLLQLEQVYGPVSAGVISQGPIGPAEWQKDLDYADKARGGASALRDRGDAGGRRWPDSAHVTMLQRSPTYVWSRRSRTRSQKFAAQSAGRDSLPFDRGAP